MLLNSYIEKFSDDEKELLFRLKGLRRVKLSDKSELPRRMLKIKRNLQSSL